MRERRSTARKRHIIVDTLGLMVGLMVHGADVQDRDGAPDLLKPSVTDGLGCFMSLRWWLRGRKAEEPTEKSARWTLDIIKRSDKTKAFEILPRRWVVERTFAWLGDAAGWRKTSSNPSLQPAWITIAHIRMLRGGLQDIAIVDHFRVRLELL